MLLSMKIEKLYVKYILLFFVVFLLSFLSIKKIPNILIFTGLTLFAGVITFLNYFLKIPIDFSPVFFLSIIITSTLGLGYTILFVILSGFIPAIFSGDFKPSFFVYFTVNILVNLISIPLNLDFLTEAIFLSFLYGFLVSILTAITGSNIGKELFVNLVTFGINLFYFWKFGEILISILHNYF